ncbi:MAG: DnaJ domain-containing protein [Minicystis sp.]
MTTAEQDQNHYQVLGIERTADERAIKKAYFALIRKFSPETHPEEFKRLREAYEVLTDPVARERYDAAEKDYREYDDEVAADLRAAEAAEKAGDEATAQATLRGIVAAHPEIRIARENLAASYSRTKSFREALEQLDALLEMAPEEARYHLYRGLVLRDLEEPKKARNALRKAHKLKPDDLPIHMALVDILMSEEAYDDALAQLDEALTHQKEGSPGTLRIAFRRVHVLVTSERKEQADAEIDKLVTRVKESEDPELKPYVAAQLAAIAGACFARRKVATANAILKRCEEIHPDSLVHHPYPPMTSLEVAALPQATQDWMAKLVPARGSLTRPRGVWAIPALGLAASVLIATMGTLLAFDGPHAWEGAELFGIGILVALVVTGISLSARRILQILSSPLRAFVTLHPLFLVEVAVDRAKVRSLLTLGDVRAVHHHVNGAYSRTEITMWFGGQAFDMTIVGKEDAESWAGAVIGFRNRALELMMAGYLEANEGAEMIPPALLGNPPAAPAKAAKAATRRWYAGTAVAALAAWAALGVTHARAAEDQMFHEAVRAGTPEAYATYLRDHPTSRHAARVRQLDARSYALAAEELRAAVDPRAPCGSALIHAFEVLQKKGETRIPLLVQRTDTTVGYSQAKEIAERLGDVLTAAGVPPALLRFVPEDMPGAPAKLVVRLDFEGVRESAALTYTATFEVEGSAPQVFTWRTAVLADENDRAALRWLVGLLGLGDVQAVLRQAATPKTRPSPYSTPEGSATAVSSAAAKAPGKPAKKP